MNPFLIALGIMLLALPTILAVVVLIVVVIGQNKLREDVRTLRADVDQVTRATRPRV